MVRSGIPESPEYIDAAPAENVPDVHSASTAVADHFGDDSAKPIVSKHDLTKPFPEAEQVSMPIYVFVDEFRAA
jgi:hypothetical protein